LVYQRVSCRDKVEEREQDGEHHKTDKHDRREPSVWIWPGDGIAESGGVHFASARESGVGASKRHVHVECGSPVFIALGDTILQGLPVDVGGVGTRLETLPPPQDVGDAAWLRGTVFNLTRTMCIEEGKTNTYLQLYLSAPSAAPLARRGLWRLKSPPVERCPERLLERAAPRTRIDCRSRGFRRRIARQGCCRSDEICSNNFEPQADPTDLQMLHLFSRLRAATLTTHLLGLGRIR
jgi:hypothetical protein